MSKKNLTTILLLLTISLLLEGCTPLSNNTNALGGMLVNFSQQFPYIWKMVVGFAYVLGISFMMRAVYYLKIYGESRSMMTTQGSMKVPFVLSVAGVALIYLPTTFNILTMTTFGTTNPLDLQVQQAASSGSQTYALTLQAVLYFVQVVGLISFVRGWAIIAHMAQQSQHNSLSKGLTHIIGGLISINIGLWIQVVRETFGI